MEIKILANVLHTHLQAHTGSLQISSFRVFFDQVDIVL